MPYFFGIGLHVLIALYFAVHAVRSGRSPYWLVALFLFPLLGSVVYFVAEWLPASRLRRGLRQGVDLASRTLDPGRDLRAARAAFEATPTAQNRMRLAAALLADGRHAEAEQHYDACLDGPFAADLEIRVGAAEARLLNGHGESARALLVAIRADDPAFRPETVSLLLARACAAAGDVAAARAEFESATTRFGSMAVRVEYALWALQVGDAATAAAQRREIEATTRHWSRQTRTLNRALLNRVEAAFGAMPSS